MSTGRKKIYRKNVTAAINSQNNRSAKKIRKLQIVSSLSGMTLARSWSVVGGAHVQAFTFSMALTLKVMVGCPWNTYPSIHTKTSADTLKITVGCLTSTYHAFVQKHANVLNSLVRAEKNWRGRHQPLCKALRRNHLVSTLSEAIAKKTRLVVVCMPGTGGQDMETRVRARTHETTDT